MNWKDLGIKEKLQYTTAVALIFSGILIAFLSFFTISDIAAGTLIYIAQAFTAGGSIFGVSIYINNKLGQFGTEASNQIERVVKKMLEDGTYSKENSKEG